MKINNESQMHPITSIINKPREDFSRGDLMKIVKQCNIRIITFHYTALDGKLKELKIPIQNDIQLERILTDGERVDGSSLFKGIIDPTVSDLYVVPIYKSAFLNPFNQVSLDFICRYVTNEGLLAPFAPDTILHKAYQYFRKQTGMELFALGELEFFLMSEPSSTVYPLPKQRGYHASTPFFKSGHILDEIVSTIAQTTGLVKYAHAEVGCIDRIESHLKEINGKYAEQLEIEMLPTPIDDAADYLVLARWIIRTIAYKNNCIATFTPKLEEGVAGNGLHVHIELKKDGKNIMLGDDKKLSCDAKKIIGGLCHYATSLTAFGNTVASSYLRLVPNQEAPTSISWSDCNRNAMIRVPLGWTITNNLARIVNPTESTPSVNNHSRQTVELRTPDGSAIVHLLLAGITLAVEWGLANDQSLDIAQSTYIKDVYSSKISRAELPKNCFESARILLSNRTLYERNNIFPSSVIEYVVKMLQSENDEQLHEKLLELQADKRLAELRKLLHKDIHKH